MPTNVVRSKEDEKKWQAAKAQAKKQGKGDNHAYIMAIYKSMKGEKESMYSKIAQELLGSPEMKKSAMLIKRGRELDPNFDEMLKEAKGNLAQNIARLVSFKRRVHAHVARSGRLKRFLKNFLDERKMRKMAPGLYDVMKSKELAAKQMGKSFKKNYKSIANEQARLLERALRAETQAFKAKSIPFAAANLNPNSFLI